MDPGVHEVVYMLEEAFGVPGAMRSDEESLLANLRGVDEQLWTYIPPGGARSIEDMVLHVGACKLVYRSHAFEDGSLTYTSPAVEPWPNGGAPIADALDWLHDAHRQLIHAVWKLHDAELAALRPAPWGAKEQVRWLMAAMVRHDLYHSGEINHIRSLALGKDRWAFDE